MRTKLIDSSIENSPGYGAGSGDTERYEYECPCGKGKIIDYSGQLAHALKRVQRMGSAV